MDAIYLLIIAGLYIATHWIARAISRLGSLE